MPLCIYVFQKRILGALIGAGALNRANTVCSENNGADQLCGYCADQYPAADLRFFFFAYANNQIFS